MCPCSRYALGCLFGVLTLSFCRHIYYLFVGANCIVHVLSFLCVRVCLRNVLLILRWICVRLNASVVACVMACARACVFACACDCACLFGYPSALLYVRLCTRVYRCVIIVCVCMLDVHVWLRAGVADDCAGAWLRFCLVVCACMRALLLLLACIHVGVIASLYE